MHCTRYMHASCESTYLAARGVCTVDEVTSTHRRGASSARISLLKPLLFAFCAMRECAFQWFNGGANKQTNGIRASHSFKRTHKNNDGFTVAKGWCQSPRGSVHFDMHTVFVAVELWICDFLFKFIHLPVVLYDRMLNLLLWTLTDIDCFIHFLYFFK